MRQLTRLDLDEGTAAWLKKWQRQLSKLQTTAEHRTHWSGRTRTKKIAAVRARLVEMNSGSPRCMYCEHDRASGIDHFVPLSHDPDKVYDWHNHIHACFTCDSVYKRDQLLDDSGARLFIDPTAEDPQQHIELSPSTGKLVPLTARGENTIKKLGLDERLLSKGRQLAWHYFALRIVDYDKAAASLQASRCTEIQSDILHQPFQSVFLEVLDDASSPYTTLSPACVAAVKLHHATFRSWLA